MSYTTFIEKGEITNARDFMKLCLRNFGIMQEHYQDPLSLESVLEKKFDIETDSSYQHYVQNLDDEYQRLKELIHQQEDEESLKIAYDKYVADINQSISDYKKAMVKCIEKNKVYEKYIKEIQKWDCSPQYENIKNFAIEQCTSALNNISSYDKEIKRYKELLVDPKASFEKHMKTMMDVTRQSIDMYAKLINRCVASLRDRKEFFEKFMEEVNNIDNKTIERYE